jgi:predicted RNase H-like HicB family nuclease
MTKYEVDIFWSDDDQFFIAEVPELPGCMAHGDTREEALQSAQEAIDLWIEVALKRGRQVPEPRGRNLAAA